MNTRYAVFAYDERVGKYLEFVYKDMEDCQYALDSFTEFDIPAFICISDECMEGKIAEALLINSACFNA